MMIDDRNSISIAFVFVLMCCFMVMSFSVSAEYIQPHSSCPECGSAKVTYTVRFLLVTYTEYVGDYNTAAHYHVHEQIEVTSYCHGCGYSSSYTF